MTRKMLPRLLAAVATMAALVAALTSIAGTGFAQTSATQAQYGPSSKARRGRSSSRTVRPRFPQRASTCRSG